MAETVDVSTLSDGEILQALELHCQLMGSHRYYYENEVERWREKPECLVVFRDTDIDGNPRLRAYCRHNF